MRAVTYSRYSSDQQSPMSIPDQQREIAKLAARLGATIVEEFKDAEISGGAFITRPGIQALLARLTRGDIDLILAEALDRISRDQEHVARIFKIANSFDAKIHTIAEQEVSELHIGLRGTMAAMFLKDLGQKVKRGLEGRIRAGLAAGGTCYGYRRVRVETGGARWEVNPDEAQHVVWMFEKFASGMSPRRLADDLNRRRVRMARGKFPDPDRKDSAGNPRPVGWISSTIYTGILRNPMYVGIVRWNRRVWKRDLDTYARKVKPEPRPENEQVIRTDESLRIIPQPLWERVHERIGKARAKSAAAKHPDQERKTGWRTHTGRHPKHMLAGILRCECGAKMVSSNGQHLGCYENLYRGDTACGNSRRLNRRQVEEAVLDAIATDLFDQAGFDKAEEKIKQEVIRRRHAAQKGATAAKRELAEVQQALDNLVAAGRRGALFDSMIQEGHQLEAEKKRLEASLKVEVVDFESLSKTIKDCARQYRDVLARLAKDGLANRDLTLAREAIAELVGTIEVQQWSDGSPALAMKGNYLGAIKLAQRHPKAKKRDKSIVAEMGVATA